MLDTHIYGVCLTHNGQWCVSNRAWFILFSWYFLHLSTHCRFTAAGRVNDMLQAAVIFLQVISEKLAGLLLSPAFFLNTLSAEMENVFLILEWKDLVLFCFWVVFWIVVAVQRPSRRLHHMRLFFPHLTVQSMGPNHPWLLVIENWFLFRS